MPAVLRASAGGSAKCLKIPEEMAFGAIAGI
jgi:hypothetical protein